MLALDLLHSEYISWKSPAVMEKLEPGGRLWGSTSGKKMGRIWSADLRLLLNWWIQDVLIFINFRTSVKYEHKNSVLSKYFTKKIYFKYQNL